MSYRPTGYDVSRPKHQTVPAT